jgi:hypothetical protein
MVMDGTDITSGATSLSVSDNSYGIGLTYYFMPANVFLGGTIGLGTISFSSEVNGTTSNSSSQTGFALQLKVGKEWWVSKRWGLGVSGGYGLVTASDKPDSSYPNYSGTLSTNKFFVLFNTTYN